MTRALALLALVSALGAPGCATPARAPSAEATGSNRTGAPRARETRCRYRITPPHQAPFRVGVQARCSGSVSGFEFSDPELAAFVEPGRRTSTRGLAELDYAVDLERMAERFDRFNVAARFGKSLLAPASSFLLVPSPARPGVPVEVEVADAPGFATGLRRGDRGYLLESHEIRVATYTAFGARSVETLDVPGIDARVALLDGHLALEPARIFAWVKRTLDAVSEFYGQPPDRELLVVAAPVVGRRGVPFGYLLPESAPGIVVLVGEHSSERDLERDWVLLHELLHVGSPSFSDEAAWFDEGLATYFEPIVRARSGRSDERALWREFTRELPRGLAALTGGGLDQGTSRDDVYWGGALFCFLADVAARHESRGRKGLEHGLRALLQAGGRSSEVWSFADAVETIDQALGAPVVAKLVERHAPNGSALELDALFRDLGVVWRNGELAFDESAPLAPIRRAILSG